MEESLALMIPILSVVGTFIIIGVLRKYQNQERMAMIEKGVDPAKFITKTKRSIVLILGGLAIGIGLGILLGNILDATFEMEEVGYFSMIFICGGVGMIVGRRMANKEDE